MESIEKGYVSKKVENQHKKRNEEKLKPAEVTLESSIVVKKEMWDALQKYTKKNSLFSGNNLHIYNFNSWEKCRV